MTAKIKNDQAKNETSEEQWTAEAPLLAEVRLALVTCDRDQMAEEATLARLEKIRATKTANERVLTDVQARLHAAITQNGSYEPTGPFDLSTGTVSRRKI